MKIETLAELEHSIGGRPKKTGKLKERMTFYLSPEEATKLRNHANQRDETLSYLIRSLLDSILTDAGD